MNLGTPDPFFVLPILVVLTSIIQQRLLTPPTTSANEQQAAMQKSMQITMPLMFGVIAISLPSGLSIYYAASNVIGIAQYMAMGKASLKNLFGTEDGSFSWRGLLGLPQPKQDSSDRRPARRKDDGKKRK
jgi:membrane protein insertase Oxa1/YidC/SpoIIIJ